MTERKLSVIVGCMFSGKTAELVRQVERAEIAGIQTGESEYKDRVSRD